MRVLLALPFLLVAVSVRAQDVEFSNSFKKEVEFNLNRRKDFEKNEDRTKIFEKEREKGLSLYIEETEKWEYLREKGISDERKKRAAAKVMTEDSPEYRQDQAVKDKREQSLEKSRADYAATKKKVLSATATEVKGQTEEQELGLISDRPRFAQDKRNKNKWLAQKSAPSFGGSSSSNTSSGYAPPASSPNVDYIPPPPDYSSYPSEGFEDLPPPPPPMPYESMSPGDFNQPNFDNYNDNFNDGFNNNPNYSFPPQGGDGWDF